MDATHWHLVLNHFPILGSLFGTLALAAGMIWKKNPVIITGLVTFIAIAVITPVVSQTGSGAEEIVEELGVEEHFIEEHEELAEIATPLMSILGLLSLVTIYAVAKEKSYRKVLSIITLVGAIGIFGLMVQIGNLGGQIRHTEIRNEASAGGASGSGQETESGERFDDD